MCESSGNFNENLSKCLKALEGAKKLREIKKGTNAEFFLPETFVTFCFYFCELFYFFKNATTLFMSDVV